MQNDTVRNPVHYAGCGIECKDALASMMGPCSGLMTPLIAYWWGCAFKYLWRWPLKGGVEDLEKCRECLGNLIECAKGGVE